MHPYSLLFGTPPDPQRFNLNLINTVFFSSFNNNNSFFQGAFLAHKDSAQYYYRFIIIKHLKVHLSSK